MNAPRQILHSVKRTKQRAIQSNMIDHFPMLKLIFCFCQIISSFQDVHMIHQNYWSNCRELYLLQSLQYYQSRIVQIIVGALFKGKPFIVFLLGLHEGSFQRHPERRKLKNYIKCVCFLIHVPLHVHSLTLCFTHEGYKQSVSYTMWFLRSGSLSAFNITLRYR